MKYTFFITKKCNLRCRYCYVKKSDETLTLDLAEKIIEFIIEKTPGNERIEIGYFGGEPLMEFDLIKTINGLVEDRIKSKFDNVFISIITNGTYFSDEIAQYINDHKIGFGVSCDGIPLIHNRNRIYRNGRPTSACVEKTILLASKALKKIFVNVVFQPTTLKYIPETIDYLSHLGIRQIYLNPDYSSSWKKEDNEKMSHTFSRITDQYIDFYLKNDPHFISLIDSKIALVLRGGYHPLERCRMGKGEFAFTPDGKIYPCERLVSSVHTDHCIGYIETGIDLNRIKCNVIKGKEINTECLKCSLKDFCMNWCGCSNFFATGYYNQVNNLICESEKIFIRSALRAINTLSQKQNSVFCDHLAGIPLINSMQ